MRSSIKILLLTVLVFFFGVNVYAAEALMGKERADITPVFLFPGFKDLKKYARIENFRIGGKYDVGNEISYEFGGEGGVTLESKGMPPLRVAYTAFGTPKKDSKGRITNAIVISPYFSADSTIFAALWHEGSPLLKVFAEGNAVTGANKILDTNKYYVIYLDALGLWGASKPSDGLGPDFPKYNVYDVVQANYRLLKDKIGVDQALLCTGVSMGAIQSYTMSMLHPHMCKGVMPIGGTLGGNDPVNNWSWALFNAAVQSDPVFVKTGGKYYDLPVAEHPKKGLAFGWSIISLTGWDFKATSDLPWKDAVKQVFSWNDTDVFTGKVDPTVGAARKAQVAKQDAQDFLYRVYGAENFDLFPYVKNIKAKMLVVHVNSDNWLIPILAERSVDAIKKAGKDVKMSQFYDKQGHYGVFRAWNRAEKDIVPFLKSLGIEPGGVTAAAAPAKAKPVGLSK